MSLFHSLINDKTKLSTRGLVKDDVNGVNWFFYGVREFDERQNIYTITLMKGTKIFDGCTGEVYKILENVKLLECSKLKIADKQKLGIGKGMESISRETLLRTCNVLRKCYYGVEGLALIHSCKHTGLCLTTYVLCHDVIGNIVKDYIRPTCDTDLFLYSIYHARENSKLFSAISIIEKFEEGISVKRILQEIKNEI